MHREIIVTVRNPPNPKKLLNEFPCVWILLSSLVCGSEANVKLLQRFCSKQLKTCILSQNRCIRSTKHFFKSTLIQSKLVRFISKIPGSDSL